MSRTIYVHRTAGVIDCVSIWPDETYATEALSGDHADVVAFYASLGVDDDPAIMAITGE